MQHPRSSPKCLIAASRMRKWGPDSLGDSPVVQGATAHAGLTSGFVNPKSSAGFGALPTMEAERTKEIKQLVSVGLVKKGPGRAPSLSARRRQLGVKVRTTATTVPERR